jgi:hypothetical protein
VLALLIGELAKMATETKLPASFCGQFLTPASLRSGLNTQQSVPKTISLTDINLVATKTSRAKHEILLKKLSSDYYNGAALFV